MKICSMCNSQVPDSYTACPNCGNPNLVEQSVQQPTNNYQQPMNYGQQMGVVGAPVQNQYAQQPYGGQPIYNTDEQLLRSYVGNNYDKISTKSWNWSAGLLSPAYLIYRKLYIIGVPIYCVNLLLTRISSTVQLIFNIALIIIAGTQFNKMYINYAKKEVEKIKAENPNVDLLTLNSIATKKGGTSLGIMFAVIIAVAIICTLIFNMIF